MKNLIELIYMTSRKDLFIVAIDGPAASGKTTIANELGYYTFHLDDFFLEESKKTKERLSEIGGNIDYERFINEVLIPLSIKKPFKYRKYSCQTKTYTECYFDNFNQIIVIEGVYATHMKFGKYYDYLIMLEINKEKQLKRLKNRSPNVYQRFVDEWLVYEDKYFNYQKGKIKPNLTISN